MFSGEDFWKRPDWPLVQNGSVNLFWSKEVLASTIAELAAIGYSIRRVDCASGFRRSLSVALEWEQMFGYDEWGGSLDALEDGFGTVPEVLGDRIAIVFEAFDRLVEADPVLSIAVLDMLESAARFHLLTGAILIGLVQTANADYWTPKLGGNAASWNRAEWLRASRG